MRNVTVSQFPFEFQTNVPNKIEIKVRRESILEDSYRIINSVVKTDMLKTKLWVEFEGEAGKFLLECSRHCDDQMVFRSGLWGLGS